MGVAVTLVAVGVAFAIVGVLVDPGAFAIVIALVAVTAGIIMAVLARTRTGDRGGFGDGS